MARTADLPWQRDRGRQQGVYTLYREAGRAAAHWPKRQDCPALPASVDNPCDSTYTPHNPPIAELGPCAVVRLRLVAVKIRAKRPDPLEFHRGAPTQGDASGIMRSAFRGLGAKHERRIGVMNTG